MKKKKDYFFNLKSSNLVRSELSRQSLKKEINDCKNECSAEQKSAGEKYSGFITKIIYGGKQTRNEKLQQRAKNDYPPKTLYLDINFWMCLSSG